MEEKCTHKASRSKKWTICIISWLYDKIIAIPIGEVPVPTLVTLSCTLTIELSIDIEIELSFGIGYD